MDYKIVVIFNQKGGSGKSTVTMQLSGTLGLKYKVAVLDIDSQQSSTIWHQQSDGKFPADIYQADSDDLSLLSIIENLTQEYEFIFIDCPPSKKDIGALRSLLVADLMIIPFEPGPLDIVAAKPIISLAKEAQIQNPNLEIRMLATKYQSNSSLGAAMINQIVEAQDAELFRTMFGLRTAYKDSFFEGTTVHNVPNSKKASLEVEGLIIEIKKILKVK